MKHFETNFFSYTNTSLKCGENVGHVRDAKFVFVKGSHRPRPLTILRMQNYEVMIVEVMHQINQHAELPCIRKIHWQYI